LLPRSSCSVGRREHFYEQHGIRERRAGRVAGISLERPTDHGGVWVGGLPDGEHPDPQIRLERSAAGSASALERGVDSGRERAVPRGAARHRGDLAIVVLVLHAAVALVREVLIVRVAVMDRT
jgi:hypothetical protein